MSPVLLWDAYKATVLVECISMADARKREVTEKEDFLEQVVGQLEATHRMNPCDQEVMQRLTHYGYLLNTTVSARMQCL